MIAQGRPQALLSPVFLPGWMIRAEGWAFVGRVRGRILVHFDPRCIGLPALQGVLEGIRQLGADGQVREFEIRYYSVDVPTYWTAESILAACCHVLKVYDEAQRQEYASLSRIWRSSGGVETQRLDWGSAGTHALLLPRTLAFVDHWKEARDLETLISRLDHTSQYISIFRMEDGDPRAWRMGGGLVFSIPNPEGARLPDILPSPQIEASRERITTAILSGEPVARRHRSEFYDVIALTVPVRTRGGTLAVTMAQRNTEAIPINQGCSVPPVPVFPEAGLRRQRE